MNRPIVMATICMSFVLQLPAFPQQTSADNTGKERLIGMWQLVSWVNMKGESVNGMHPNGLLAYDSSGHFSAQIMPDLPRSEWPTSDTPIATTSTNTGYTAYFGTYTIDERAGTVTHHIEANIRPAVGTDNIRKFEFGADGSVTLTLLVGGGPIGSRLTWKRADR